MTRKPKPAIDPLPEVEPCPGTDTHCGWCHRLWAYCTCYPR